MSLTQCICENCKIQVPVNLNFRGKDVTFEGCNTTVKCPKCGKPLKIPDGTYASNLYGGYLKELSSAFEIAFNKIRAEHNFEYGSEFEVALCDTLSLILPRKYGVCRGYIVDSSGNTAGNDIIVYDRVKFPTLRLEDEHKYDRLQQIPSEAAYLYIEAKHALVLNGDGGQSLAKALSQVAAVKTLCAKRSPVLSKTVVKTTDAIGIPKIKNPLLGAIFARYVKRNANEDYLTASEVTVAIQDVATLSGTITGPDIIVAGTNTVLLPFYQSNRGHHFVLPFVEKGCKLLSMPAEGIALGVAIADIIYALEWIQLGPMPWTAIISDGLGIPYSP